MVREAAGNPTYRALAAAAGFGATTLSDAAGGVRKPSLEVTLAYVGACRGDVEAWERRWHELDQQLAGEPGAEADGKPSILEPEEVSPADGAEDLDICESDDLDGEGDPAGAGRRGRWFRWLAVAAVVAVVVTGGLFVARPAHRPAPAPAAMSSGPDCQGVGQKPGVFTGKTYSPVTRIRDAAALGATAVRQLPSGCVLQFSGFCLGDVVVDATSGTPDLRWFKLTDGGMVSSAVVHGNPPAGMKPSDCTGSVPMPVSVSLSVVPPAAGSDMAELRASGVQLGIVGFAAYYADAGRDPQSAKWHQVGITKTTPEGFAIPWRLGALGDRTAAQTPLPLVAVACLGGDGATEVHDAIVLPPGSLAPAQPATLAPEDVAKAEKSACAYQTTT